MAEIKNLRAEARRLRLKIGRPISDDVLNGLGRSALLWIIRDARKTINTEAAFMALIEWDGP